MSGSRRKPAKSSAPARWFSDNKKYLLSAAAAVVLIAGSFGFATGAIGFSGNALVAQAIAAITGRPILIVSRDYASPAGSISMGSNDQLAVYDVSVSNVTHWATVSSVPFQIAISQAPASQLSIASISLQYTYCIPVGETYGYGYRSNGCASSTLIPSSLSRNGNTYYATFYAGIPVYPQQSSGKLTVSAVPYYSYTGNTINPQGGTGSLTVQISGISGAGDQCIWSYGFMPETRTYGYGYTNCVSSQVIPNITSAYGNTLTVQRPYGYGYYPFRTIAPTQQPPGRPVQQPSPTVTSSLGGGVPTVTPTVQVIPQNSASEQDEINQLQALIAALTQELVHLLQQRGGGNR